ncbi:diguanylate cyclase with GGDEF domain [Anaerobacterium chartisolvens]|uniref:Stage 0 sporulation protein A homolog n=1 Tax=Anaerobacterium chartisolvens TaxID=1297424 RepID=A0A369B533_9FIRM|nr:response regulator [Anaerobacterium chartisolvens]RCX14794.1 diguanylate cyclase with GGDEF domain [Anaerobacterium chartisolvens]
MPFTILSVDKSGTTGAELSTMLKNMHANVIHAEDEEEAESLLLGKRHKINVVVWAVNNPESKDLEFIKKIKSGGQHKSLPVIVISGFTDKKHIIKAIEAGVNEYIAKPYDQETVVKKLYKIMGITLERTEALKLSDDIMSFSFFEMLDKEIKGASRGAYPLTIMMGGIQSAGNTPVEPNDSEDLLKALRTALKCNLRGTDTCFYYDTSKLIILLPFANKQGAEAVKAKINKLFDTNSVIQQKNTGYKLNLAGVSFPEDGKTKSKLLEKLEDSFSKCPLNN